MKHNGLENIANILELFSEVFKNREFIKIDIDNLDIEPKNTFIDAKLSIAKEYDQLNTEIDEKTS